jgi:hypothetical protein
VIDKVVEFIIIMEHLLARIDGMGSEHVMECDLQIAASF